MPVKKRGRPLKLTDAEREQIRQLFYHGRSPLGKPYTMPMLARMFKVSTGTIAKCL